MCHNVLVPLVNSGECEAAQNDKLCMRRDIWSFVTKLMDKPSNASSNPPVNTSSALPQTTLSLQRQHFVAGICAQEPDIVDFNVPMSHEVENCSSQTEHDASQWG